MLQGVKNRATVLCGVFLLLNIINILLSSHVTTYCSLFTELRPAAEKEDYLGLSFLEEMKDERVTGNR